MSFLRHGESIAPMRFVPLGASGLAHSQRSSDAMSSSRLFLDRLLSSRARLRFAGCERFSKTKSRRTMIFQRTATAPLTHCLSPRVHSRLPRLPCHTTVHAGPHTAVRRIELRPHDHGGKPELGKVGFRQSNGQGGRVRNPPRAVRTPGS
jgi:hypothetical protein